MALGDPRLDRGLSRQLAARRQALGAGAKHVGWKAGLGTDAAMASLGTDGPLVGYLTDATLLSAGASWSLAGRVSPRVEPEIAVRVDGRGAIVAVAAAIELVDMRLSLDDPEAVLACNIFHEAFVLGEFVDGTVPERLAVDVEGQGGAALASFTDEFALGDLVAVVARVGEVLEACGLGFVEGDVVITGSLVPPVEVSEAGSLGVWLAGGRGASVILV